eukprot:220029-Chlamydomonas_euryale.AAC.3
MMYPPPMPPPHAATAPADDLPRYPPVPTAAAPLRPQPNSGGAVPWAGDAPHVTHVTHVPPQRPQHPAYVVSVGTPEKAPGGGALPGMLDGTYVPGVLDGSYMTFPITSEP